MFGKINILALIFHGVIISFCSLGGVAVMIAQKDPAAREIPGFISIDCGATNEYLEDTNKLWYHTDSGYIDSGENMELSPEFMERNIQTMLKTVRSFPYGMRNCYTMRPKKSENSMYLIRAHFYHGNYDGKNEMPIFDLYIGVNKWAYVHLEDISSYNYFEINIIPPEEDVQICLVNTGHGNPFINGLELWILENALYHPGRGALYKWWRIDAGTQLEEIRYPDDVYDRRWIRSTCPFGWSLVSNESIFKTNGMSDIYKVPNKVLISAVESLNASIPLSCQLYGSVSPTTWHIYFHFAEIQQREDGWKRKVRVSTNNTTTKAITLEYAEPMTLFLPLYGTTINFSISAAEGSRLPPIVNAIEIFRVIDLPNLPTLLADVDAITSIKKTYAVTKDWQGDPCVPRNFAWESINCSYNNPSRIVSLNLSFCKLAGEISISFSKLKEIQILDLSYNNLSGPMPKFLGELPNLKILYLMGNNLTGPIPSTLKNKVQDGALDLNLAGNPLCQTEHCQENMRSTTKRSAVLVITSVLSTITVLAILCSLLLFWRVKRSEDTIRHIQNESIVNSRNRPFRYNEVLQITENLKTVIGEGGFGKVYLGHLIDGTKVAVKLLSTTSHNEFQVEAQLLMIVHHKNLVSQIGYCYDGGNMALIYKYMANGSLRQHLSAKVLSWKQRLQIAVDVAQGLEYLHNGCELSIIHRDLKPSNILLDENMQAKIADFGLSRRFLTESATHVTTRVAGTFGYVDPEFQATNNLSKASDVYSFGIILFELITGRSAIVTSSVESISILDWVMPLIDKKDIQKVVDPTLHGNFEISSAWKAIEIAKSCTLIRRIQRPDMSIVLVELKQCLAIQLDFDNLHGVEGNSTNSRFTDGGACLDSEAFSSISAR